MLKIKGLSEVYVIYASFCAPYKELGHVAELSFMANNFLNMRKYHINPNTGDKSKLHPDTYFGAEVKLKF